MYYYANPELRYVCATSAAKSSTTMCIEGLVEIDNISYKQLLRIGYTKR
jgi:hypothetical protein